MKGWVIMRKIIKGNKAILSILLCFALAVPSIAYAKTTVRLNKKSTTIQVGKTVQLKVNGTKKKVSWNSSNKKVATVTNKGKVKGIKAGKATITAKVEKKKLSCKVTVKKKEVIKITDTPKVTDTPIKNTETPTTEPVKTPNVTPVVTLEPTSTPEVITLGALEACELNKYYTLNNGISIRINDYRSEFEGVAPFYSLFVTRDTKPESRKTEVKLRVLCDNGEFVDQFSYNVFSIDDGKIPLIIETVTDEEYTKEHYANSFNPNELHWVIDQSKLGYTGRKVNK